MLSTNKIMANDDAISLITIFMKERTNSWKESQHTVEAFFPSLNERASQGQIQMASYRTDGKSVVALPKTAQEKQSIFPYSQ